MITSKQTRRVIRNVRGKYENQSTRARAARRALESTQDDSPERTIRVLCYGMGWDAEPILQYMGANA